MLEAILHPLIHFVTETIGSYGVPAVFVLMLLESMGILIPSEAISPFAGFLVSEGKMSLFAAVSAGVLGNVVGSGSLLYRAQGWTRALVPVREIRRVRRTT